MTKAKVDKHKDGPGSERGQGRLRGLADQRLSDEHQRLLDEAGRNLEGADPTRRYVLQRQGNALLALAERVPHRLRVRWLDLSPGDLRAVVEMPDATAPVRLPGEEELGVLAGVVLGLRWSVEALLRPLPGHVFLHMRRPARIYHPNASFEPDAPSALCLGGSMPRRVPVSELVLGAWGLLTLQTLPAADVMDPAGVLNGEACVFYRDWMRNHPGRVPLTRTPFLSRKRAEMNVEANA